MLLIMRSLRFSNFWFHIIHCLVIFMVFFIFLKRILLMKYVKFKTTRNIATKSVHSFNSYANWQTDTSNFFLYNKIKFQYVKSILNLYQIYRCVIQWVLCRMFSIRILGNKKMFLLAINRMITSLPVTKMISDSLKRICLMLLDTRTVTYLVDETTGRK